MVLHIQLTVRSTYFYFILQLRTIYKKESFNKQQGLNNGFKGKTYIHGISLVPINGTDLAFLHK